MIFGYEVGSTQVVVIGRSNLAQDPRGTRRVPKKCPKKRECVAVHSVHSLSCTQLQQEE